MFSLENPARSKSDIRFFNSSCKVEPHFPLPELKRSSSLRFCVLEIMVWGNPFPVSIVTVGASFGSYPYLPKFSFAYWCCKPWWDCKSPLFGPRPLGIESRCILLNNTKFGFALVTALVASTASVVIFTPLPTLASFQTGVILATTIPPAKILSQVDSFSSVEGSTPSQTLLISYSPVNSTEIFRASLPLLNPFSPVEGHTLHLLLEKAMYIWSEKGSLNWEPFYLSSTPFYFIWIKVAAGIPIPAN